jgi:hypothetical protein
MVEPVQPTAYPMPVFGPANAVIWKRRSRELMHPYREQLQGLILGNRAESDEDALAAWIMQSISHSVSQHSVLRNLLLQRAGSKWTTTAVRC